MNKETLDAAVAAAKENTRSALQTVFDALNSGQQKKILKDEKVAALFTLYGVETEDTE